MMLRPGSKRVWHCNEKGDYRRATAAFDKAIAIDPTMAEVWNNRGLSLIQTGDYQDALKSINKALSINPYYENARKAKRIVLGLVKEPGTADGASGGSAGFRQPPVPSAPEGKQLPGPDDSHCRDSCYRGVRDGDREGYAGYGQHPAVCDPDADTCPDSRTDPVTDSYPCPDTHGAGGTSIRGLGGDYLRPGTTRDPWERPAPSSTLREPADETEHRDPVTRSLKMTDLLLHR